MGKLAGIGSIIAGSLVILGVISIHISQTTTIQQAAPTEPWGLWDTIFIILGFISIIGGILQFVSIKPARTKEYAPKDISGEYYLCDGTSEGLFSTVIKNLTFEIMMDMSNNVLPRDAQGKVLLLDYRKEYYKSRIEHIREAYQSIITAKNGQKKVTKLLSRGFEKGIDMFMYELVIKREFVEKRVRSQISKNIDGCVSVLYICLKDIIQDMPNEIMVGIISYKDVLHWVHDRYA